MKKASNNFSKFGQKKSNAAIKEQFKQEKRKWKKEREAFFDKKKQESRAQSTGTNPRSAGNRKDTAENRQAAGGTALHPVTVSNQQMPLNKFIAHAGICARRDAAEMVKLGKVKVNGETITAPGHKVSAKDLILVNGKKITLAKNLVYILINKPKDYITTTEDPQGRKTVLDLIRKATPERVFPVGRLDRNTSGVLLLTNDGELAQKLTHPSNEIKKVYAVTLDRPLEKKHFDQILKGITLEDGPASVDALAYADVKDKTQLGVEIHSGRNRIVRRIFEHLGYDVKNLDRVIFAGLTKKNIERGKWRFLSEKEVRDLKYFSKGR
jgi:23S rRNA pseudouridine2605 synthase